MKKTLIRLILFLSCIFFNYTGGLFAQIRICEDFSTTVTNTANTVTVNNPNPLPPSGTYSTVVKYTDNSGNLLTLPTFTNAVLTQNGPGFTISLPGATLPADATTRVTFQMTMTNAFDSFFLDLNFGQCNTVLPVTLISFNAQKTSCNVAKLEWVTADEYSMQAYEVEKSADAISWNMIAQVTPYNTSGNHTYQYYDRAPYANHTYYRLRMVNTNATASYSNVVYITCASCNGTPPPINYAQFYIQGPSSVCTTGSFSITNGSGLTTDCVGLQPMWMVSPSNIATITPGLNGYAYLTATGNGYVTVSAVLAFPLAPITKTVYVGIPPIVTSSAVTATSAYTSYLISIVNPTGASTSYTWYSNGSSVGNGLSKYYYVVPNTSINYSVSQSTACGTATASGNLVYQTPSGGGGGGGCLEPYYFTMESVSGSGKISINRLPPPCYLAAQSAPAGDAKVPTKTVAQNVPDNYELKVLDFQGNLRIAVKNVSFKNRYDLNVRNLPRGNYIVQVINNGVIKDAKKIRID